MSKNKTTAKKATPVVSASWAALAQSCESGSIYKIEINTITKRKVERNPATNMMQDVEPETFYNCQITFKDGKDSVDFDTNGKTISECLEKVFINNIIEKLKEVSHEQK